MPFAVVQAALVRDSLLPEDLSINTWHFNTADAVETAGPEIVTALDTFYNAIETFLSLCLTGTIQYKMYDLTDPSPRAPRYEANGAMQPGTTALPSECAIGLSYRGVFTSGVPNARRRGRLFIGPLSQLGAQTVGPDVRVTAAARTTLGAAAAGVANSSVGTGNVWSVFSPTIAGPPPYSVPALTAAFATVTQGWVDDAFDTQRRRGAATTARSLWAA